MNNCSFVWHIGFLKAQFLVLQFPKPHKKHLFNLFWSMFMSLYHKWVTASHVYLCRKDQPSPHSNAVCVSTLWLVCASQSPAAACLKLALQYLLKSSNLVHLLQKQYGCICPFQGQMDTLFVVRSICMRIPLVIGNGYLYIEQKQALSHWYHRRIKQILSEA